MTEQRYDGLLNGYVVWHNPETNDMRISCTRCQEFDIHFDVADEFSPPEDVMDYYEDIIKAHKDEGVTNDGREA